MDAKQKRVIDSFVRVQAFLAGHPALEPASYAIPKRILDEAVRQSREYAGAQVSGLTLSKAEMQRVRKLAQQLVDRHIRPIVTIAQALRNDGVQLPPLRLPGQKGFAALIAFADGLAKALKPYESVFVEAGRPFDFLAQLRAAHEDLEIGLGGRAAQVGAHIGATKGMQVQLNRGRLAVKRIDAVARIAFEGNAVVLEQWRAAKRVYASSNSAESDEAGSPDISPLPAAPPKAAA